MNEHHLRASLQRQIEIEKEISKRLSSTSLYHFVKYFWPIIEPGTEFVDGWHIRAICSHLEAVSRFEIKALAINIPPRHMKSTLACVAFPAWVWATRPYLSFIYGSHSLPLATRDSIKTRQIIESERYQEAFNPDWHLLQDQNLKMSFKNSKGGSRHSVGVGSGITGFGGDFLFIDDPISALEAHSEIARNEAIYWHDSVLSTRVNDPNNYAKCLIMQRLHEEDLTGHVIKSKSYEHLCLPAEYDPDHEYLSKTSLGFKDPRTQKGEILWPERWTKEALDRLRAPLGIDAEAQLNQSPKAALGGLFPTEDWCYYDASPSSILETVLFIDAAQKPGVSNDYSVFAVWARSENAFFLLDLWRQKTDAPTLEALTKAYSSKWSPNALIIEDKSAGSSLIQYLIRNTTLPVLPFDPGQRDKVVRATAATPTVRAGKCYLPKAPIMIQDDESKTMVNLIDLFVKEHNKFPKVKHDDMVDTTSMMVEYFSKRGLSEPRIRSL